MWLLPPSYSDDETTSAKWKSLWGLKQCAPPSSKLCLSDSLWRSVKYIQPPLQNIASLLFIRRELHQTNSKTVAKAALRNVPSSHSPTFNTKSQSVRTFQILQYWTNYDDINYWGSIPKVTSNHIPLHYVSSSNSSYVWISVDCHYILDCSRELTFSRKILISYVAFN
jgi:hypothetical protein